MVATVDALGRVAYTLYDERGRAKQKRAADPDGSILGVAPVTRYRYDAAGRVLDMVDPLGYSTTYEYDWLGRLTKEQFAVDYQVIDAGDPGFARYVGTQTAVNQSTDYGGDSLLVSPTTPGTNPAMEWTFNGLAPGNYRILATWSGQPTATTNLHYRLSDYFNEGANPPALSGFWPEDVLLAGVSQRVKSDGVLRYENGAWNEWAVLHAGFAIGERNPGIIGVHFSAIDSPVHADAVRIERLATRSYQYDANGNLTASTDELNRTTNYFFDELDRQWKMQLPDPDTTQSGNLPPETTTAYDGYGNVASVKEMRGGGNLARLTEYVYDHRNRRTMETFDVGVDAGALDYRNRVTTWSYDPVGNLTEQIELPGHATLERRTTYKHDKLNRQTRQTLNSDGNDDNTTPNERVTVNQYDSVGNLIRVDENPASADPRQIAMLFRYDALGRVIEETEQGRVNGNTQKRITRFQYDAVGNQTAVIDPLLRVSRSEYDRLDRRTKSTDADPDGLSGSQQPTFTFNVYDAAGQVIFEINSAGETKRFEYDPQGQLIRSTDGRGDVTRRQYDAAGNLVKLTDPAGNSTTYVYDGLDRVTTETTASGPRQFIYDSSGNVATYIDRNGRVAKRTFDRQDRVTRELWYTDFTTSQASSGSLWSDDIDTIYDALGRTSEQQHRHRDLVAGAYTFSYRLTDSYLYDGLDRTVEHSNQSLSSANHSTGPAARQTYTYGFDAAAGTATTTREQFVGGAFAARTVSHYNGFDELAKLEDRDTTAGGVPSTILDFEGTDAAFDYWADGALKQANRLSGLNPASYKGFNNHVETIYGYDGAGRVSSLVHQTKQYNGSTTPIAQTQLVSFGYGYDNAGRINLQTTGWNTAIAAFAGRPSFASPETLDFDYDLAGQLTGADSNQVGRDSSYAYLANGNRSQMTEPFRATSYGPPAAHNRLSQDGVYSYVYDSEGNILERRQLSDNALDQRYTWDHRNRLVKVENYASGAPAETIDYRYDASDNLVYRSLTPAGQAAQGEHYVVEAGERTMTLSTAGKVLRRYERGPTGETLFDQAFNQSGQEADLLLPLGDHQHSTRVVAGNAPNGAVTVRQSIDYAPFGQVTRIGDANGVYVLPGLGATHLSILVTASAHHGSLLDVDSGLQLKGARWYDSQPGRFISEDPIQDGANWYLAFGNNPVMYADPTGLYQAGHPLQSGSRQLDSFRPSLAPTTTTFQGFVGAGLGNQTLRSGPRISDAPYLYGPAPEPRATQVRRVSVTPAARPQAALQPSLRSQLFSQIDTAGRSVQTGYNLIDVPAAFFGNILGNAVAKPIAYLGTHWRADTQREREQTILNRQQAHGTQHASTVRGLVDLYASGTTDQIAYGSVGYDPVEQRSLDASERITRVAGGTAGYASTWIPVATGANLAASSLERLGARSSLGHGRRVALEADVEFQAYRDRHLFDSPGQAHHLNVNEILGGAVPYDDGLTTPLSGRAFADSGSPHFTVHRGLEAFIDQYRQGTGPGAKYPIGDGPLLRSAPTFSQYNRALYNSLQEAGVSPDRALRMVIEAKTEQMRAGFRGIDLIPELPRRMGQLGGP